MTAEPEGSVVELEIRLDAPPEDVFPYLVDPERYVQWQGVRAELDPRPGGAFRVWMDAHSVASGEYVAVEPPISRRLHVGVGGERRDSPGLDHGRAQTARRGDRTVLTLRHTGLPDQRAAIMHREGWDLFTERLRLVVRGQDPGPLSGPPAEANL